MRVRRLKLREDGEGAAPTGDASSGNAAPSSTNTVSALTGPATSYDDIRKGAAILGRDNFVMPGDRRGRTPKKKRRRLPMLNTKEIVLSEAESRIDDETRVVLTIGQLKKLISEFL